MHKLKLSRLVVILVLLFGVLVKNISTASGKKVEIRKCCRHGDYFDQKEHICRVGGGSTENNKLWNPKVYQLKLKKMVENLMQHMHVLENEQPTTCSSPEYHSNFNTEFALLPNGSLYSTHFHDFFDPEDFCVDKGVALICTAKAKEVKSSAVKKLKTEPLRKCCAPTEVYLSENKTCALLPGYQSKTLASLDLTMYDVIYTFPDCQSPIYAIIGKFEADKIDYLTETLTYTMGVGHQLGAKQFCVESVVQGGDEKVDVFVCDEHVTSHTQSNNANDSRFVVYSIGLFISVAFLGATLAIGFLTPSNHHIMHWKCQTNYIACLLVGEFLLAITQLSSKESMGSFCFIIAIVMHFFFLAAFFWLNTMCFNIWWTFRDFRPTSMERRQEICRLHLYEIYAWGFPSIIVLIATILDCVGDDSILRPRFAQKTCWFSGDAEIFAYFFAPIGILLFMNLLLFAMTTRQLTCGLWKRDDVKSTTERAALGRVCLKLVVVMGITWIADVVSWAIGGPQYLWYITDIINALQGVFIFCVVASQPQVQVALRRMCCNRSGKATNTTNGPQHSSSSHGYPASVNDASTQNTTSSKIPNETAC